MEKIKIGVEIRKKSWQKGTRTSSDNSRKSPTWKSQSPSKEQILGVAILIDRVVLPIIDVNEVESIEDHLEFCDSESHDVFLWYNRPKTLSELLKHILLRSKSIKLQPIENIKHPNPTYII